LRCRRLGALPREEDIVDIEDSTSRLSDAIGTNAALTFGGVTAPGSEDESSTTTSPIVLVSTGNASWLSSIVHPRA
jgi:hypothetical protein